MARHVLRIRALGSLRVESGHGPIEGEWLDHRPGQVLKYLICEHGRATTEQIAEALWPSAALSALGCVRHYVHVLRSNLEPGRSRGSSSYVAFRNGAYLLDRTWVRIDAEGFERGVAEGLQAFASGDPRAAARLASALALYEGDLLAEDPYAVWTLAERDRLRDLAGRGLRTLSELQLVDRDLESAASTLRRLVDLDSFDTGAHRRLIEVYLRQGRRSEAWRRYMVLRRRMMHQFGETLDFEFTELVDEGARQLELD